jgi:hypothetical protein
MASNRFRASERCAATTETASQALNALARAAADDFDPRVAGAWTNN